ncbi:hypothetical protein TNCV_2633281 [Trichonephila clavipes]|nr:hypothetical protein TNCV_2633281 [Trichonephila clavipes]
MASEEEIQGIEVWGVRMPNSKYIASDPPPGLCSMEVKGYDESVRNLSTNLLRRLFGEYKFAYITNQLQEDERDMQSR